MDEWPTISCKRFDGENLDSYRRRSAEVIELIDGFRRMRFRGEIAERMERRLLALQEPHLDYEFEYQ